jgi:FKBP-type peptidyl-prolyl cis-trans isomerase SlyD
MEKNNQSAVVRDDMVVSLDYTLTVDGEVVDSSRNSDPIQFIQGQGQLIPGLERQLYGMEVGDSKHVVVSASEGYGEQDPGAYADIPRGEFPPQIPLEQGVELQLTNQDGEEMQAFIEEVGDDSVRLNFNHPLAGKELHFSVEVVDLRQATSDELEHGHVHDGEGLDEDY